MVGRDLANALETALRLSGWAQRHIVASRPGPGHAQEKSGPGDWVTTVDREVEAHIRAELLAAYPSDTVVGEEAGASTGDGNGSTGDALTWYLDPIDGTTNFVHGLPGVSVSIAAVDTAGPAVGVVHDVYRNEVFSAVRGGGLHIDGRPFTEATRPVGLRGGLLLTEWSGLAPWPAMAPLIADLQHQYTAVRVLGSCALSLASVAAGRATAVVLGGHYNPWDVLAGAMLAREAGCVLFDADGPRDDVPMHGVGAARPDVTEQVQQAWHRAVQRSAPAEDAP